MNTINKIKLDMNKLKNDYKLGVFKDSHTTAYGDSGYNLSHYMFNNQPNTRLCDYINNDVYIFISDDLDYSYIEDYGNGVPNWVYDTVEDIKKVLKG